MQPASRNAALRGVLALSSGTIVTRGLAAVSQLLLVVWLSPEDFGLWASTVALMSILSGLVNFGEVNGYLSGEANDLRQAKSSTRRINLLLTVLGLGLAVLCYYFRSAELAFLCVTAALTLVPQGESSLLLAAATKHGRYRAVVTAQALGALSKLCLGALLAATIVSAQSLAISTAAFFVVICLALSRLDLQALEQPPTHPETARPISVGKRAKWATNSLMLSLPIQAGFLVAQFLTGPENLGLYFVGYQITLGLSGLIAEPLAKVGLSTLAKINDYELREALAVDLCSVVSAAVLMLVAMTSLAAHFLPDVTGEWADIKPMAIILLASLPLRMMGPILDSLQQSSDRWWRSTSFNALDVVGTSLASFSALTGSALLLGASVSFWKIIYGASKFTLVLSRSSRTKIAMPLGSILIGSMLVLLSSFVSAPFGIGLLVTALLIGATYTAIELRKVLAVAG